MADKPFFDTTVLIYVVSKGDARADRAEALLADGGILSVQVLNEFAAVARRKLKMPWPEIREALGAIRSLCEPAAAITAKVHDAAMELAAKHNFNIYDALIVSSAMDAGCDVLFSEDMQHNRRIGGLTIRNPFGGR